VAGSEGFHTVRDVAREGAETERRTDRQEPENGSVMRKARRIERPYRAP
jgi:hypothetical protein